MDPYVSELSTQGFAWIRDCFTHPEQAFAAARELLDGRLDVVGDFVVPPLDGEDTRDFQTLHFDFGLPLDPKVPQDVARYTVLHVPRGFGCTRAVTRVVPLRTLLGQRAWPSRTELLARFADYGRTHGAWDDSRGYVEGSLARIVEAAAESASLPSVKQDPSFLCGMEFDSLHSETLFFARHSLTVAAVQREIPLAAGELLVFDNLAVAHGRRGVRSPGELRQRAFGEPAAGVARQRELREPILDAFAGPRPHHTSPSRQSQVSSPVRSSATEVSST